MEQVAIYNRCSTEDELQMNALAIQAEESAEIVRNRKDWNLVEQFVESQSGTTARKRTQYQRMLAGIEEGRFTIVVIKSIDRLARNVKDWYLFLDCMVRNQVRLYLYLEGKFYTPEDSLITGIKAILAEEFSRELSKKIKNSHKRRQEKRSGYNITREMFGWNKIDTDVYEINEEEAYYYRVAFELAEKGYGYRRISNQLYEMGARNKKGLKIGEVQWRKMLRTKRAHGTVVIHTEEYDFETKKKRKLPECQWITIENALPPIISEEYHRRVLAVLDERAGKSYQACSARPKHVGHYDFSGKLICGECGKNYYRFVSHYSTGEQVDWKCSTAIREGTRGCGNIRVEEAELYRLLEDAYGRQNLVGVECRDEIVKDVERILQKTLTARIGEGEKQLLERKLQRLNAGKHKLMKSWMENLIEEDEFKEYHERLKQDIADVEAKLESINAQDKEYIDYGARIYRIKDVLRTEHIIERAWCRECIPYIDNITVYSDGRLELRQSDEKASVEMYYRRVGKGEKRRRQERNTVLEYLRERPDSTLSQMAKDLEWKASKVYARVRELKDEGVVTYEKAERRWLIKGENGNDW